MSGEHEIWSQFVSCCQQLPAVTHFESTKSRLDNSFFNFIIAIKQEYHAAEKKGLQVQKTDLFCCKNRAPTFCNKAFFCNIYAEHAQSVINGFFFLHLHKLEKGSVS